MNRFVFFSIVFFISCGSADTNEVERMEQQSSNRITLTDVQYKNAGIDTGRLEMRTISAVVKVNGKIEVPPQNMVSISVPLGGYLKSTRLIPGMYVHRGQVLATLEDSQYIQLQQDYLTAKAQFSYYENEYMRQKELNESKASSDKVYQQAKATYHTQQVLIKSLEEKLRLIGLNPHHVTTTNLSRSINLYAPVSGYVSAVNVNQGKYVTPSEVMFELVNPNDIHLALNIFEKDISKIKVGQKLWAYSPTNMGKKYPCEIILINKNLTNDNSVEVHCHFDSYDKALMPGMFMTAEIEYAGANTAILPEEAIVRYENKHYVFTVQGKNEFAMIEIEQGESKNGYTQINNFSELTNQNFVTKGAYNLLMTFKNSDE